jgi:polyphenol oxidase
MIFNNLQWGMSEKKDGAMNIRLPNTSQENLENRKKYLKKEKINLKNIVAAELVHSTNIKVINGNDKGTVIANTDGLITNNPNIFLTITVGDCLPIYLYDEKRKVVGLLHAGWRGVVNNICRVALDMMINRFNSEPKNIFVYIGPHLQKCHFQVKENILPQFKKEFIIKERDIIKIDLLSFIKEQILICGVSKDNMSSSNECTYCNEKKFFSYRRDKPEEADSMLAYIGMNG